MSDKEYRDVVIQLRDLVAKEKLLGAITTARNHLSLKDCLESIGLTAARYHS